MGIAWGSTQVEDTELPALEHLQEGGLVSVAVCYRNKSGCFTVTVGGAEPRRMGRGCQAASFEKGIPAEGMAYAKAQREDSHCHLC